MKDSSTPVAVIMGSASDAPILAPCMETLRAFDVGFDVRVLSAHRTPDETAGYVKTATENGIEVFVAAAGMAAHLAGVVAANTTRPVIGIPIASGPLNGRDSLLATIMMPPGVPVATVGVNGAVNAALLSLQILALSRPELREKLSAHRKAQRERVLDADRKLVRG